MKKLVVLSLLFSLVVCAQSFARVQYDSTGRHVVNSATTGTQRGQKHVRTIRPSVAAAAKLNYSDTSDNAVNNLRANYPQKRSK